MKGHVPTPSELADKMAEKLFEEKPPSEGDRILYPGLGEGPFVSAVCRYCNEHGLPTPKGVGIELDPEHVETAKQKLDQKNVEIQKRDFLGDVSDIGEFEYIIGNPPYVPIEGLDEQEKNEYKSEFDTANGRFDLYILFFERALELLKENGRLTFITPEKYTYVGTGSALRRLMTSYHVEEIEHVREDAFDAHITYPAITTISNNSTRQTRIIRRNGDERVVNLPPDGSSWASKIRGGADGALDSGVVLGDISQRVSCGVATGADSVFVVNESEVAEELEPWTYPTVSGSELGEYDGPYTDSVFICPYEENGNLVPEGELGEFGEWARDRRDRLEDRSCVRKGKKWYAWHENPPMEDILQPKIVFRDVAETPHFWVDERGEVVPRHSVYYLIPEDDSIDLDELAEYLNSEDARVWMEAHCQRAHNDYLRLQSTVLKDLPVPEKFGESRQATLQ